MDEHRPMLRRPAGNPAGEGRAIPGDDWLAAPVHYGTDLVQVRIDLVCLLAEPLPLLAELRRLVRRLQLLAAAPLDVVDDPPPIEAAMQADRHEARLGRHEA